MRLDHFSTSPQTRSRWITALIFAATCLLAPSMVHAACNTGGCWSMTIQEIEMEESGRIWLITDQQADLGNLAPANGCIVQQIVASGTVYALYISPADPNRNEKYAALLTAFVEEKTVDFLPTLDSATGWCALGGFDLHR